MKKIDQVIIRETIYISAFVLVFSVLMQSVFLVIDKWNTTVLFGNILGALAAIGNFFLMGLTVQASLEKEEKEAKNLIKVSQTGRLFLLFGVALVGYLLPCFNIIATVLPFLFPRIAVMLRPLAGKLKK
ncbi:MAG: hypothetical protein IJA52_07020 [Clostridia bacterium]|nr:hypothetical protein [Clostridia bacterium]